MYVSNQNRTFGLGLLIIVFGLVILLNQLDVFPPSLSNILVSWQMLLIAIGIYNVLYINSRAFGIVLIVVGGFFILPELFDFSFNFKRNFWPVILIIIGFFILFKSGLFGQPKEVRPEAMNDLEYIDEVNIFSGSEKKLSIKNFRGGKITSIFGGSEIDLTGSELAEGNNTIDVFYLFGGSSIKVPENWVVTNKVTSILGGFSDKRVIKGKAETTSKSLVIRGFVMFGGGEIESV
ncbi:MAG: hypothetical protein JW731_08255 [Bacteroidales bacterium]|nr:hypothetical protein [Bacteroidales bacterium]